MAAPGCILHGLFEGWLPVSCAPARGSVICSSCRQAFRGDAARPGRPPSSAATIATLAAALMLSVAAGAVTTATPALAQVSGDALFGEAPQSPQAQMFLESDELIYDDASNTVAAVGNVQIAYDGYTLVAERVTYDRASGRVLAQGAVEIVEPNGNRVFAQEIDVTDDFQNGFVSALRVETPENTLDGTAMRSRPVLRSNPDAAIRSR